ncbi:kinase [Fusarium heterosporum]|uniref:Kinase n=1 Tax=Fusarium heterosporum TaxID=42747 RepID=A0A8H5TYF9_FUSHE|nr:kinase [Fusarium heterosporum]
MAVTGPRNPAGYRDRLTSPGQQDLLSNQGAYGRGHQTHPGASKTKQTTLRPIDDVIGHVTTYRKHNKTPNAPEGNLLVARKGFRNVPRARIRVRELGSKVSELIIKALDKEPGLQIRIRNAAVYSCYPGYEREKFLPNDKLKQLLLPDAVRKVLIKCDKYRKYPGIRSLRESGPGVESDVKSICSPLIGGGNEQPAVKSYRKIFVILLLIKKASIITAFIHNGICDDDLPLRRAFEPGSSKWKAVRENGEDFLFPGFQDLKKGFYVKFIETQWLVLAPYFDPVSEAKEPQILKDAQIPPFTSWYRIPDEQQGGYGEIIKACIHSSHHGFNRTSTDDDSHTTFAVKLIRKQQSINPKKEASILRKFRDERHEHLISILAIYIQHGEYHFIFPWAIANLHGFWKDVHPHPSPDEAEVDLSWMAAQCQGLAEGLSFIHRYETSSFGSLVHPDSMPIATETLKKTESGQMKLRLFGRHGDIKPENILYFPRHDRDLRGTLKITDFGCTDFSTKKEVNSKRLESMPNSPTYRAPKTDIPSDDTSISASYDVWTLGCVYLEFIIWWLGGWTLVEDFARRRLELDPSWYGPTKGQAKTDFFFTVVRGDDGKRTAEVRRGVTEVSNLQHMPVNF